MTEARPHLSIGEVLSLLQDEFPDITISKIRFLESQGLLNPERTPSGYRKFYDQDVDQLRWVLRQQKENFLPLKVIKDRLAAGKLDGPASESGVLDLAPTPPARPGPALAAAPDASANGGPVTTPPATVAAPMAEVVERPLSTSGPAVGEVSPVGHADRPTPTSVRPNPMVPAATAPVHPEAAVGSSASLTSDDLCAATGVSPMLLAELERYGLVGGRPLGPDTVYDEEAMVICRLAVTMADAGVEARHLRMFKVAAEREAGLYEQLALPRVRGQRPEARREAVAQVTALTGTAAELHAVLLRRSLRSSLGPL